jgi:hypothetical protein
MIVCTECLGNGYLQHGQRMTQDGGTTPNFTRFGDNKQWPETLCPSCLGNGYQTGAGT